MKKVAFPESAFSLTAKEFTETYAGCKVCYKNAEGVIGAYVVSRKDEPCLSSRAVIVGMSNSSPIYDGDDTYVKVVADARHGYFILNRDIFLLEDGSEGENVTLDDDFLKIYGGKRIRVAKAAIPDVVHNEAYVEDHLVIRIVAIDTIGNFVIEFCDLKGVGYDASGYVKTWIYEPINKMNLWCAPGDLVMANVLAVLPSSDEL